MYAASPPEELAAGLGDFSELVVHALDRVRGVDDAPDIGRQVQEWDELVPGPAPDVDDRWTAGPDRGCGERLKGLLGGLDGRRGVDGPQARRDGLGPGRRDRVGAGP